MQIYTCYLNHAGNRDMKIYLPEVTPAEIMLLKRVHGADSVVEVALVKESRPVQQAKLRAQLLAKYGEKIFVEMFPGSRPMLPLTLADAGMLPDGRDMDVGAEEPEAEDEPPAAALPASIQAKLAGKAAPALT